MWTVSEDEKELEKLSSRSKGSADKSSAVSHCAFSRGGGEGEAEGGAAAGGGGGSSGRGKVVRCSNDLEEQNGWNSGFPVSTDKFSVPPGDGEGSWSQTELEPM